MELKVGILKAASKFTLVTIDKTNVKLLTGKFHDNVNVAVAEAIKFGITNINQQPIELKERVYTVFPRKGIWHPACLSSETIECFVSIGTNSLGGSKKFASQLAEALAFQENIAFIPHL